MRPFFLTLSLSSVLASNIHDKSIHHLPTELLEGCLKLKNQSTCPITSRNESNQKSTIGISSHCLQITGFSDRDFNANGLYCKIDQNAAYHLTAIPNELRYEMQCDNDRRCDLLRVIKTTRGAWVGFPIYAGFPKTMNSNGKFAGVSKDPQQLEWVGLSLNRSSGEGAIIDRTKPSLNVSSIEIDPVYVQSIDALHRFRSNEIDACDISICDGHFKELTTHDNADMCIAYWKVAAQLSDASGNHVETARRLEEARSCGFSEIKDMASNLSPIPRMIRWEIANLSDLMAKSLVKAGKFHGALDATLVGLANSPESKQRRRLYADLGDLKLVMGESDAAFHSYTKALDAVREKGGAIESKTFLQYFENSVGALIAQVMENQNYGDVRISMLLQVEKRGDREGLNKLFEPTMGQFLSYNKVCEVDSLPDIVILYLETSS